MPKGCKIKTASQARAAFASGWEGPTTAKGKKKVSKVMRKGKKKKK